MILSILIQPSDAINSTPALGKAMHICGSFEQSTNFPSHLQELPKPWHHSADSPSADTSERSTRSTASTSWRCRRVSSTSCNTSRSRFPSCSPTQATASQLLFQQQTLGSLCFYNASRLFMYWESETLNVWSTVARVLSVASTCKELGERRERRSLCLLHLWLNIFHHMLVTSWILWAVRLCTLKKHAVQFTSAWQWRTEASL